MNDPLFINRLHRVVEEAAVSGDPVALECRRATTIETVRALVAYFQSHTVSFDASPDSSSNIEARETEARE